MGVPVESSVGTAALALRLDDLLKSLRHMHKQLCTAVPKQ